MIFDAIDAILIVLSVPVALAAGYLALLTAASARLRAPRPVPARLRFDLVVPAHDEEAGIAATVRSLLAVEYPAPLRRVLVVADNCSDRTAERASEAGAEVLVRHDPLRRGKGYALATAFAHCLAREDGGPDAVVVVDADTVVTPNLLAAMAARLEAGADAVQAHYAVRNGADSWRTRLMAIAFCLFHRVRSLGRERLGLSAGLRGNGMCFSARLLRAVPHDAFSVVEDLEYGVRLGFAGFRVHYADEAEVFGDMVSSERASRSQRRRWEGGRRLIARQHAGRLLREALARRDRVLLDLALDVLVPPLATIAALIAAGTAAAGVASLAAGTALASVVPWLASAAALGAYVARGVWVSGTGLRGAATLLCAPAYVAWKLALPWLTRGAPAGWVRTAREAHAAGALRPAPAPARDPSTSTSGA